MDNWLLYAMANRGKGGGGSTAQGAVRFLDYDGTVVYSYTPEQFAKLSAMPANPMHEGLTSQGWNYTLESAQSYVAEYGALDVGQMYITDDGKTRIYISLKDGRLNPRLGLAINGSVVVDWGDRSATDTMTGPSLTTTTYQEHTYAAEGEYVISLEVIGTASINGLHEGTSRLFWKAGADVNNNKSSLSSIIKVELGENVGINEYAFKNCSTLKTITIPEGVTSIGGDLSHVFENCFALTGITIPMGVTSIGENTFACCYALASITIPESVIKILAGAFQSCYTLSKMTIPKSATMGKFIFQYCIGLANLTIPDGVTSISSNAFAGCYALASIKIPEGVTSIGSSAFWGCYALASITIPESVTSIDSNAFAYCYGLGFIKFRRATPATVSNADAWSNVPTDCIIYVPQGSLSAYTSNSKYPSSSTYTYVEY